MPDGVLGIIFQDWEYSPRLLVDPLYWFTVIFPCIILTATFAPAIFSDVTGSEIFTVKFWDSPGNISFFDNSTCVKRLLVAKVVSLEDMFWVIADGLVDKVLNWGSIPSGSCNAVAVIGLASLVTTPVTLILCHFVVTLEFSRHSNLDVRSFSPFSIAWYEGEYVYVQEE